MMTTRRTAQGAGASSVPKLRSTAALAGSANAGSGTPKVADVMGRLPMTLDKREYVDLMRQNPDVYATYPPAIRSTSQPPSR